MADPDPPKGGAVTWDNWVSQFSTTYCVSCHGPAAPCGGSACHIPSNPSLYARLFDMREKSAWTDRAEKIRCGIAAAQDPAWACDVAPLVYPLKMDGYPLPPDEDRATVVDWVGAGCP